MTTDYTNSLTAEQLIEWIAADYVELSHDKVLWQRNSYIRACRDWIKHNLQEAEDAEISRTDEGTDF